MSFIKFAILVFGSLLGIAMLTSGRTIYRGIPYTGISIRIGGLLLFLFCIGMVIAIIKDNKKK